MKKLPSLLAATAATAIFLGVSAIAAIRQSASTTLTAENGTPGQARLRASSVMLDSAFSPVGGSSRSARCAARFGHAGQLYDVASATFGATPFPVLETARTQLGVVVTLDDGTRPSGRAGEPIGWQILGGPLASITITGIVTSSAVWADAQSTVRVAVAGSVIEGAVLVRDVIPDNFGPVAGDQLDDAWQFAHFDNDHDGALDLPAGPSDDADADGAANHAEWLAGTHPLHASRLFRAESKNLDQANFLIRFGPLLASRRYAILKWVDFTTAPEKVLVFEPAVDAEWLEAAVPLGSGPRAFFQISIEVK